MTFDSLGICICYLGVTIPSPGIKPYVVPSILTFIFLLQPIGLYDNKPHRSLATSAQAFKVLLRDSPTPPAAANAASPQPVLMELPMVHGPAAENIATGAKSAALELNGFEKGPLGVTSSQGGVPVPSLRGVAANALKACLSACQDLTNASQRRLGLLRPGIKPWAPSNNSSEGGASLEPLPLLVATWEALGGLQQATLAEATAAKHVLDTKLEAAKVAAKAAEAAGASGGGGAGAVNPEVAAKLAAAAAAEEAKKAAMKPEERER